MGVTRMLANECQQRNNEEQFKQRKHQTKSQ